MNGFLPTYFGTECNDYHAKIGAMFLVAMVKRIYEPGCQCDYALVLEGGQGAGKSSACRILAGDRYFSDSLPRLGGDEKRISMHLRSKWLIEIAELAAMKRGEVEDIKAFITRRAENYLPSYAKLQVNEPRTCVFVATTNDDRYLKDDTGERRFWPAKVGVIDLEALERDREQLFAEAAYKMRDGYRHWPDHTFEERWIKPEQAKRKVVDPREEIVVAWAVKVSSGRDQLTGREIAAEALGLGPDRYDPVIGKIIGRGMKTAGWLSDHKKTGTIWTRPVRVKE
jgi:predicted P-loop ATPase